MKDGCVSRCYPATDLSGPVDAGSDPGQEKGDIENTIDEAPNGARGTRHFDVVPSRN